LDKQHKNSKVSKKKIDLHKRFFKSSKQQSSNGPDSWLTVASRNLNAQGLHDLVQQQVLALVSLLSQDAGICERPRIQVYDCGQKIAQPVQTQTYTHRHMPQKSKLKVIIHHKIGN
jgi:hypothetical protein